MSLKKETAQKLFNVFGLIENQGLTNEQQIEKIELIIDDIMLKSREQGYNSAIKNCISTLQNLI